MNHKVMALGSGGGGGGLFPCLIVNQCWYILYTVVPWPVASAQILYIYSFLKMSKVSKMYFYGKSRFVVNIQELSISADMCQRCQGSKVVYTIYLPHCGRESISDPINTRTRIVSFKS